MSHAWRTKADVLKDLGSVNGRRTGAEHLDRHVVEGERPPPIHHEAPDEDEINYFSGGHGGPSGDNAEPDLAGISVMLKMVNAMDESGDHIEPVTIYHNRATDEIRISKLNPLAGEYVPGSGVLPSQRKSVKTCAKVNEKPKYVTPKHFASSNMFKRRSEKKIEGSINEKIEPPNSIDETPKAIQTNVLQNHISKSMSNLLTKGLPKRRIDDLEDTDDFSPRSEENVRDSLQLINSSLTNGCPKGNIEKSDVIRDFSPSKENNEPRNDSSQLKLNLLPNGVPKRKIEKSTVSNDTSPSKSLNKLEEIKVIQEKIQSTIIASSNDNSLQTKRQKNVAIATLLKLGTIPPVTEVKPVKLVKPAYFENAPSNKDVDIDKESPRNDKMDTEHVPSTSSSEVDLPFIDTDSISKVNGWFNNMECPKPKPQPEPLVLKQSIAFKKKDNASVKSQNSDSSKDKDTKEQTKQKLENNTFKPSAFASDLLKKYESNAERAVLREDLGTRLERQLRERDELIKQKMLARQNAG